MRILVTGATGSIGGALVPRLRAGGHDLRALSRRPVAAAADSTAASTADWRADWRTESTADSTAASRGKLEWAIGDAVSGEGLEAALAGIDVAYYLIHSMEPRAPGAPGTDEGFAAREATAARNFGRAAAAAGVGRVVYLGGPVPETVGGPVPETVGGPIPETVGGPIPETAAFSEHRGRRLSEHLRSRLEVERVLLEAVPDSVAFRASIVIGARSRSFRFLVRLVERMPVLLIPAWREHRTAPVDERDVTACLELAATAAIGGRSLDIAGPDVVSYGELIDRIRDLMLLGRPVLNLPHVSLTPLASRVSAIIAGEQHALIGPLMEGLEADLLPRRPTATDVLGLRSHSLDAAIERALREWETVEVLRAR